MADGNSQTPIPEPNTDTNRPLTAPVAGTPGLEMCDTTSPVVAGTPGPAQTATLSGPEGTIAVERHPFRVMPVPMPAQDVPPGESAARP